MRSAWLSWGLVVLVGAAVPLACGQKFQITGSAGTGGATMASSTGGAATSAGGDTSTSTSTSTSTMTTTSTGAGGCVNNTDCNMPTTVCGSPFCINGKCGLKKEQEDGSTKSQVYGDCHELKCKNAQLVNEDNEDDVYEDANACTEDLCVNGVPTNKPRSAGDTCSIGGTVCDGKGACVECTGNNDCTDPAACPHNYCVPPSCFDTVIIPLGGETDVDCGGPTCQPCSDTKKCLADTDCVSGVCQKPVGQNVFRCITPSCMDNVKNGTETAKDCGGPDCTDRCAIDDACSVPSDCTSGVCMGGKCIAPSCTDGVKNGNEAGVDCGANCPACFGG